MMRTLRLMTVELAAHWRAYRRAVQGFEPIPFAWTAIGYRIRTSGIALREYLALESDSLCLGMLAIAGTITYGGLRKRRPRTFYRLAKRGFVPESSLPGPWEFLSFGQARPKPSRKRYKRYRAVARGLLVFIRYKGREVFFKKCITEEGARNVAKKLNGKQLTIARLTRTQKRRICPHCDKSVALSWWERHQALYHMKGKV